MRKDASLYSIDGSPLSNPATDETLTDRLNRVLEVLRAAFPQAVDIGLEFDGKLHAHIDVRGGEEVCGVESKLPNLNDGMFTHVAHGATPHHPFFHRISAIVVG